MKQLKSNFLEVPHLPVASQRVCLYDAALNDYHFCHHPALGVFRGNLYAMWSNGQTGEDEIGQRVMYAVSKDGQTWSPPQVLCSPLAGPTMPYVMTAAGFHTNGEKLVAYIGAYEYKRPAEVVTDKNGESRMGSECFNTTCFALVSHDGVNFADPIDLCLPLCPNYGPKKLMSGRLLMTGNWAHAYTDDPSGLEGWELRGFCPDDCLTDLPKRDDPSYFWNVSRSMGLSGSLCEGSYVQDADGTIHMMHRSYGAVLFQSDSTDDGESWSYPEETTFPNGNTKFFLDHFPDGRMVYIGSPGPDTRRCPLVISFSSDGRTFTTHYLLEEQEILRKFGGCYKGGMYAYPHAVVYEGALYVIYSLCKEDIYVARIPLCKL